MRHLLLTLAYGAYAQRSEHIVHLSDEKHHSSLALERPGLDQSQHSANYAPTPRPVSAPKSPGNYAPTYQPTESEDRRLAGAPTLRGSYSV